MSGSWDPRSLLGLPLGGRFRLDAVIAAGGMGVVYRATDIADGEQIAVKMLRPLAQQDPEIERRFYAEAEALRGLNHPSIPRIVASGEEPGLPPWIAMELVEGGNLAQHLLRVRSRGEKYLPTDTVLSIGIDIAAALAAAHERGIVHRDVKPGNVVIDEGARRAKLVDFGVSKRVKKPDDPLNPITRPGDFIGTTDYAAPEQWNGEAVATSDVYSLALTLAEAMGGSTGFHADGSHPTWPMILRPLILRGESERLIGLFAKALDHRPELRPSAAEMRTVLLAVRSEATINARPKKLIDADAVTRAPHLTPPPPPPKEHVQAATVVARPRKNQLSALVLAGAALAAMVFVLTKSSKVETPVLPAKASAALVVEAPKDEDREQRLARIAETKDAIAKLDAAFARDVKAPPSKRERYLRYDCARMERLSFDVDGLDHPLAIEGRASLAKMGETYGDRCKQALAAKRE